MSLSPKIGSNHRKRNQTAGYQDILLRKILTFTFMGGGLIWGYGAS